MQKVLHILGTLDLGGAETMVMNLLREGVLLDIAVCIPDKGFYEDEAVGLGASVYHLPRRSDGFIMHHQKLMRIIKGEHYEMIHIHTQNAFLAYIQIKAAKAAGAKSVIVHSHNTMDWRNERLLGLHRLFRKKLYRASDVCLACSTEAASWLFGRSEGVTIIPLPVNCNLFKRDEEKRENERIKLGIGQDEITIVCVGRFSKVKNQEFLVDVLNEIIQYPETVFSSTKEHSDDTFVSCDHDNHDLIKMHQVKNKNFKLIYVGDGEYLQTVQEKVEKMALTDSVIFTGQIKDPYRVLNAADIFVLPSFYEGFPTVVLEATAAGLPCLISDAVSKDMDQFPSVQKASLNSGADTWAHQLILMVNNYFPDKTGEDALNLSRNIILKDYSAPAVADRIRDIYLSEMSRGIKFRKERHSND